MHERITELPELTETTTPENETLEKGEVVEQDAYEVIDNAMKEEPVSKVSPAFIDKVNNSNYLELTVMKSKLTNQLDELTDTKEATENFVKIKSEIDAMEDMDIDDMINPLPKKAMKPKRIKLEKSEDDKLVDEISEFDTQYDDMKANLEESIKIVTDRLSEFTEPITTTYLRNNLIETLTKRLEFINEKPDIKNKPFFVKKINRIIEILSYGGSYEYLPYLKNKMTHPAIKKLVKEYINSKNKGKEIEYKTLNSIFTQQQLSVVSKYLEDNISCSQSKVMVEMFLYHMDRVFKAEEESGNYMCIKLLFLDIIDVVAGIYDVIPVEEFNKKLNELFDGAYPQINNSRNILFTH